MASFKLITSNIDIKIISELAKEIWQEHYTPIIGIKQVNYMLNKFQSEKAIKAQIKEGYTYYSIEFNKKIMGYISIKKENETLFLSKIYIAKTFRGLGFGKATMNFIEDKAKEFKCTKIYLTVNKHNTNSIKAYYKIGFKKTEEIVINIGNGFIMDDYKMEKTLIN